MKSNRVDPAELGKIYYGTAELICAEPKPSIVGAGRGEIHMRFAAKFTDAQFRGACCDPVNQHVL